MFFNPFWGILVFQEICKKKTYFLSDIMVQVLIKKPKKDDIGLAIPEPFKNELPTFYAERVGNWYSSYSSSHHRKQHGQFFTPISVARFMAAIVSNKSDCPKILDPGAGCGILSCAVCETLLHSKPKPHSIHLDLFETDKNICSLLDKVTSHLADYLHVRGVKLSYSIYREDFVLQHADVLHNEPQLFSFGASKTVYDLCISNPPYFKLSKSDPKSIAAGTIVYGQPNIYFLFMSIAASMLKPKGELIFITPRSFASGSYFQKFRHHFFNLIKPQAIHIFESRKEAFKKDNILQENIIFKGIYSEQWHKKGGNKLDYVSISVSHGYEDIDNIPPRKFSLEKLLDMKTRSKMLRIPQCQEEEEILDKISSWKGSFTEYGLKISTGPVVAFRAKSHLASEKNGKKYVPLLWLHHVQPLHVEWPKTNFKKPQYIELSGASEKLLINNQNCILVRRFSAKEENRRLVAAPLCKNDIHSDYIGLENHLNYIYKKDGVLTKEETWGLAVILNCRIIDTYYRIFNGSTQVGASEIAEIPLPPWETIRKIGAKACSTPQDKINVESLTKALLKS